MFFGFQLTCGLMMVFYGYSVMKNPRVWGDQGRQAVKAENFPEYCRQNGLFFLKAGLIMALIGALDALVSLSGVLYVLLYLFGLVLLLSAKVSTLDSRSRRTYNETTMTPLETHLEVQNHDQLSQELCSSG